MSNDSGSSSPARSEANASQEITTPETVPYQPQKQGLLAFMGGVGFWDYGWQGIVLRV